MASRLLSVFLCVASPFIRSSTAVGNISCFNMDKAPSVSHPTGTSLEIRDLPADVLILALSLLHGQDIAKCTEVCHCFADLVRSDLYLQYKIELAQNGMVDGDSSTNTIPTSERLQRLREYSSRFRSGAFDHEDLAAHPHYVREMRNVSWVAPSLDGSSLSSLNGSHFYPFTRRPDVPLDTGMFLSTFTPGSALAGIQSSCSLLRISAAEEHTVLINKWAIDTSQDLLVMSERFDISMPEHLRLQPEEFCIHFYSLNGSKTIWKTPHASVMLPSVLISTPAKIYDMPPIDIDELRIAGEYVIWALAVKRSDECQPVVAVFVGMCNWKTGETISCINVGTRLVHVIPLGYPYLLVVPKAVNGDNQDFSIYSSAPSGIPNRPICTLLMPDEVYQSENGRRMWYDVHSGDRPQTSEGYFHADLSLSMVVVTCYHRYSQGGSEHETHYLIPRTTLLAQIHHAESRRTQTRDLDNGGPGVQVVPWADWGPQGCLRLSQRCLQDQRVVAMPFGTRFPLFVVDGSAPRSASVYVFDINPHVARYQRQIRAARKHGDPATVTSIGTIVEDIEGVLPGVVDPDCSSIPYVAYRFSLLYGSGEPPAAGQLISAVVMGMTGFMIKISGGEYEKREQTWTV